MAERTAPCYFKVGGGAYLFFLLYYNVRDVFCEAHDAKDREKTK